MKKLSLLFLLSVLLCGLNSNAQIAFSKEYGGAFNEDGRWMEQTADSGYILTGGTTTFSNGQTDIWLVKTDAYGNTQWTKSIGGTAFDFANMVKPVPGGYVICGLTNRNGSNDGIIVKTDALGNTLWTTVVGDAGIQEFEGFIPTSDGGYAATGVNYTTGTQYYDAYLVKFNAAGVFQWSKNLGGQGFERGNAIQETADHGFIIAGQSYSYAGEDGDYWMTKTDSNGVMTWYQNYAFPHIQEAHYVQITPDHGFVLVGDADTLPNGLGDTDVWLIKTDSAGNFTWGQVFGGTKKDGGKTVENTSDGGFIIAGITRSGLIDPNFYLIKTDGMGALDWEVKSYGTTHHDHAYRGIETSDGGYAEFGFFRNGTNYMNFALVKLPPNGGVSRDVGVDAIEAPNVTICRSNSVDLSVLLSNYGSIGEANIIVDLSIDNGTTVTLLKDTLTSTVASGAAATLTFTPTYNFNVDGNYTIKAFIQHRAGDISYTNDTLVTIIAVVAPTADPTTTSANNCANGPLTLTSAPAAATDSMFWYDAPTGGALISAGTSYTTPSLSSSATYYVQSVKGIGSKTGRVDNTTGTGATNTGNYLKFDSRTEFKLISVKVYATSAGNRTIQLRDNGGTVLQSVTVNIPVGESRVYLNFDVPEQNDLQLRLSSSSPALFYNSSGTVYPFSVSQTVEIYGSNSSNGSTYYYFYDWYIFVPHENCGSNRVPVQAIIGNGTTTAFDRMRCGSGHVTLTANSTVALSWYAAATGGSSLATGGSYTTPTISATTPYYLQVGSCANRIEVNAIVNSVSTPPVSSDETRCGPGTITLTATSSDPIFWNDAAANGTQVGSGGSFTTPFLTASQTYYAVAGNLCPSTPTTVHAIVNAATSPIPTSVTACGPASVTLTATASDPINWYSSSSGGTALFTGNSFITPILSSSVTYYVEAVSSCPSPRVPVTANIVVTDPPVGSGGSRCGTGTVVISAQSIDPITWWSAATGGTLAGSGQIFTTPSITSTTTYYAQATNGSCTSARTAVTATINVTSPPGVTPNAHCGPGTVVLGATSTDSIFWYAAASGGSPLGTGPSFTTPNISATTTYYAQAGGVCPSTRVAVDATISSPSADPTPGTGVRCGTGSVNITAASPDPITWYDVPTGGISIGTGSPFATPSISTTTTFYAVAGITGCFSNRVAVVATVNPRPADPVIAGDDTCGPGQLTLTATASDPLTWFSQPTGGSSIATGGSYTANFNTTTTVYVESNDGTCSSNRIPVTATIYTLPSVNIGPPFVVINPGNTITLDPGPGFVSYNWSTGVTTQSIDVNTTDTFYVSVIDAHGCTGSDTISVTVSNGINNIALDRSLEVYPNPSHGSFTIKVNNAALCFELEITDVTGRVIVSDYHKGNILFNKSYDLADLAKGVYYLKIYSSEGNTTRPLIIQ